MTTHAASPTIADAMPCGTVLIVDDEPGIRIALGEHFSRSGWRAVRANGVREAVLHLRQQSFDLIVSDIRMPDGDGMEVLHAVRRFSPHSGVILLTAFASVPDAVRAMRSGASDYLTKPVAWDELETKALRLLRRTPRSATAVGADSASSAGMVGRCSRFLHTISQARAVAATDADVLIEAESGTGKELLARLIHAAGGNAAGPFTRLHCATTAGEQLDSELFGTPAQPGRFEQTCGGTLLLDQIGTLPFALQPKLLRVLERREIEHAGAAQPVPVHLRVIATSTAPLAQAVACGQFRSDLYHRLNIIALTLPPLRERLEDLPALAQHFAEQCAARTKRPAPVLLPAFLEKLAVYDWPGNVRELANFMWRVLAHHPGRELDGLCCDLGPHGTGSATAAAVPPAGLPIRQLERLHLENTLALTHGNRTHAAELLGISLRTMRNKIREYGLPPRSYA